MTLSYHDSFESGVKRGVNVISSVPWARVVKKVELIYRDLDNHWIWACFLLITSDRNPWAVPENMKSLMRSLVTTLWAFPRQSNVSAINMSLHLNSAMASHNRLTVFEPCSDSAHLLLYPDSFLQVLSLHHHSLCEALCDVLLKLWPSLLVCRNRLLALCLSSVWLDVKLFVLLTSNTRASSHPSSLGSTMDPTRLVHLVPHRTISYDNIEHPLIIIQPEKEPPLSALWSVFIAFLSLIELCRCSFLCMHRCSDIKQEILGAEERPSLRVSAILRYKHPWGIRKRGHTCPCLKHDSTIAEHGSP
jgi:hypothetical protein